MKKNRKFMSILLALSVAIAGSPTAYTAADTTTQTENTSDYGRKPDDSYIHRSTGGKKSQTMSSNDYSKEAWGEGWHAHPSNNFLEENEDGTFLRISFFDDEGVFLETYDADFNFVSSRQLTKGIWTARGYFKGKDARYIVYKQNNYKQSDEKEVVRVVKYDDNWNILGRCSISAINTYEAFSSGSVRILESDGILYIHAAHTMYSSGSLTDDAHHQANMTLEIDEATMKKVADMTAVSNPKTGYVSHSWNQFIQADDNYIYRLDQGDFYPRAISLSKQKKYYEGIDMNHIEDRKDIFNICGKGQIYTGVSIGGFELIGNTLFTVGNSIDPNTTDSILNMVKWRNVFVNLTDKDTFITKTLWLTNYTADDKILVHTPHTVVVNDGMYVLWEEGYWDQENSDNYAVLTRIAKIKNDGTLDGKIYKICGRLTDCKPILTKKGHIVWYMTNDGSPVFYNVEPARLDDICFDGKGYILLSGTTMKLSQDTYTAINDGKTHAYKPDVEVYYKGEKLTPDKDYTLSYEDNYTQGTAYAVITGKGMFSGWNKTAFTILPAEENTWEMPNWWGTTKPTQTPSASAAPTSAPENTPAAAATAKPTKTPSPTATKSPDNTSAATPAARPSSTANVVPLLKITKLKTSRQSGKRLYVSWKKPSQAKGYEIQYAQSKNFKKKLKTVKKYFSMPSYVTLKKMQKKKTYYIRVRAYTRVRGKKVYGKWSSVKKVKY